MKGEVVFHTSPLSSGSKVVSIRNVSLVDKITHDETGVAANIEIAKLNFAYSAGHTIVTSNGKSKHYYFDSNSDLVNSFLQDGDEHKHVVLSKHVEDKYALTIYPRKSYEVFGGDNEGCESEEQSEQLILSSENCDYQDNTWGYNVFQHNRSNLNLPFDSMQMAFATPIEGYTNPFGVQSSLNITIEDEGEFYYFGIQFQVQNSSGVHKTGLLASMSDASGTFYQPFFRNVFTVTSMGTPRLIDTVETCTQVFRLTKDTVYFTGGGFDLSAQMNHSFVNPKIVEYNADYQTAAASGEFITIDFAAAVTSGGASTPQIIIDCLGMEQPGGFPGDYAFPAEYSLPEEYTFAGAYWEHTNLERHDMTISQTNFKKIAENNFEKVVILCEYDNDKNLIKKRSGVIYATGTGAPDKIFGYDVFEQSEFQVQRVYVEKYFYDTNSNLVETHGYFEGEEKKSGINIAKIVYDKNGNAEKTFSYNSLDCSTKFDGGTLEADDENKIVFGSNSITQSTEDGEANTINTVYTNGCLTELDSGTKKINYDYDAKRRLSAVKLDGVDHTEYEYAEDCVTTILAPGKLEECIIERHADSDNNLLSLVVNGTQQLANTFDNGLLVSSIDGITGKEVEYAYNSVKCPTSVTVKHNNATVLTENFGYNNFGEITQKSITGGGVTHEYGYAYKENSARDIDCATLPYELKSQVDADVNGRMKSKTTAVSNVVKAGEYYFYRKIGDQATDMVSSIRYGELKNGAYVINDQLKYIYDDRGNIIEIRENGKIVAEYEYDSLNHLIKENDIEITYDNNGNILTKGEHRYIYDAIHKDRLKFFDEAECIYDSLGNPIIYRGNVLTWQKGRQLASWNNGGNIIAYQYDGSGRRIKKGNTTFTYTHDGKLFTEKRTTPSVKTIEYLHDQTGIIGFAVDNNAYHYRKNLHDDVTHIFNASGVCVAKYSYDAWGNHEVIADTNGVGALNPIRYRSYYWDAETQTYFLVTRHYDPMTARFINMDSVEHLHSGEINGLNLYAYCKNNAISNVDPTGECAFSGIFSKRCNCHYQKIYDYVIEPVANWTNENIVQPVVNAVVDAAEWVYDNAVEIGLCVVSVAAVVGGTILLTTGFTVAGGALIGAGIGSLVGGFTGLANGGSFAAGWATGAVLGGAVGAIIGAGGIYSAGGIVSLGGKITEDLVAYTMFGTPVSTWEDYALAFIYGGATAGKGFWLKYPVDVALRPLLSQVAKIGTARQEEIKWDKYLYDLVARGITYFIPKPWRSFGRGLTRGFGYSLK